MSRRSFYGDYDDGSDDEQMFRTSKQLGWRTRRETGSDDDDVVNDLAVQRTLGLLPPASPSTSLSVHVGTPRLPSLESLQADLSLADTATAYETLKVSEDASQDEIKRAYKKQALRWHPDRHRSEGSGQVSAKHRFQRVGEAFAILFDPKRRAEYDETLRQGRHKKASRSSSRPHFTANFRSSFVNEPRESRRGPTAFGPDDLRNLDPMYLFQRIFGETDIPPPAYTSTNDVLVDDHRHPLFGPSEHGPSRSSVKQKPFNLEHNHQQAHLSRNGNLKFEKSHQSLRMTQGGGMMFQSTSVSGSFGGASRDMMQAFMAGVSAREPNPAPTFSSHESLNNMHSPLSAFGIDSGRRSRRQSFGGQSQVDPWLSTRSPLPSLLAPAAAPNLIASSPYASPRGGPLMPFQTAYDRPSLDRLGW